MDNQKTGLDLFTAVMIAEGAYECPDRATYIEAYAVLIRTGVVWQLQGVFGRCAADLIVAGIIDNEGNVLVDADDELDGDC